MSLLILSLIYAVTTQAAPAPSLAPSFQWNVLDVSYLYPLPKTAESSESLRADDQGARGKLFPENAHQRLAPVVRQFTVPATERSRLRVMGVRIDPCGLDEKADRCLPEIRMVWQTLKPNAAKPTTEDGAFHTFFRLSESEFQSLVSDLAQLKRQNESAGHSTNRLPLTVHPAFLSPKTPAFREALRRIWLKYCGEKNLVQVTVMREENLAQWHRFEGIHRVAGEWRPLPIPRVGSGVHPHIGSADRTDPPFQDFFNDSHEFPDSAFTPAKEMKVSNIPAYAGPDSLEKALRGYHAPAEQDRADFDQALRVTYRIDNPLRFHTGNLDCVHCHLAEPARGHFIRSLPRLEKPGVTDRDRYPVPAPWILQAQKVTIAGTSTKIIRSFGYYFDQPVVNTRVIHESIRVAEMLQKQYPVASRAR